MSTLSVTNLSDGVRSKPIALHTQLAVQSAWQFDHTTPVGIGTWGYNTSSHTDTSSGRFTISNTAAFSSAAAKLDKLDSLTSSYAGVAQSSPTTATKTASSRSYSNRNAAGGNTDYDNCRGSSYGILA